ncbi:MAG TPA: YwqG family protein [Chitinophagaceae bacterium]|nr:YwqG family protein [Chitinophagaceae bacterium]
MPRQKIFTNDYHSPKRNAQTEGSLKRKIDEAGLSQHWDFLKAYMKHEVLVEAKTEDESAMPVGKSKMGGLPDLPKGVEWFTDDTGKPLSFIGQVNMSDLIPYDQSGLLPSTGILYFFYTGMQDAWGDNAYDKNMFRVYYYDGSVKDLMRRSAPGGLEDYFIYDACKLVFEPSVSLPYPDKNYLTERMTEEEINKYDNAIWDEIYHRSTKLLGYADASGDMELGCELIAQGQSAYHIPAGKDGIELAKQAADWLLLFQVDSDERESGMMWGDGGRLYFWIKMDDLRNKRFDRCWVILQST